MKKEYEMPIILLSFGVTYTFFGFSLILPLLPSYSKILMGIVAIGVGSIFFLISGLIIPRKIDKK